MGESAELPLAGHYRGGPTHLEHYLFLRLYPDGFWLFQESFDPGFDFPAYLADIGVDEIKRRYPRGHCLRAAGGWRYRCGRYTRQGDLPVIDEAGNEVCRLADGLALTTWDEESGEERLWEVGVAGPGRLMPSVYSVVCEFVPDAPAEPAAAAGRPCD